MKNKIPSIVAVSLMLLSLSVPGMAQKYGRETVITPGIHPHCTRSHDGALHVVLVNEDKVQYVKISPDGIPGNPETIAYGSDLQAPYIAESKSKLLHVVWGEGYNAMYSNNKGGTWQVKSMLPPISGYGKNRFPHVAGGYGDEAYVASWNHTSESIRVGVHVAYQVNLDNTGKVTGTKSKVLGKVCEVAPSVVGPTALLDCGGKVYAVATAPGGPDYYAHELNENFELTSVEAIGNRSPYSRWTRGGIDAFPMENGPAFLGELRTSSKSDTTPKVSGVMINFKDSGKIGAMFVDYAPKWCCPRGTYDPVSKNIYGIYNKRGTLVLDIFNTETFSLQNLSSEPLSSEISAGTLPGQCGWGAGGIAARIDGGADMVYSVDSTVKMRSIDAQATSRVKR